jgi:urease accessory protein
MKENLFLAPAEMDIGLLGQLEGYTHQASFTCVGTGFLGDTVNDNIHEILSQEEDICFGISSLCANGFTARLLGYRAEQLHNILKAVAAYLMVSKKTKELNKTTSYAK